MAKPKKEDKFKPALLAAETIDDVISVIRKKHGDASVQRMGDDTAMVLSSDVISTGSVLVDTALGIGGLPKGRIIEIYGPEGGGKTTLAISVIAACQKMGGKAGFIDAEHALDGSLVKSVGADLDNLVVSQPDYGEQGLDILQMMLASKKFDILVVDSVAALTPKAEIEGEMDDQQVGAMARMMGKALRKMTSMTASADTMVIFINQLRMKIGVMFGSPETTPGGNALKFFSSIRIDIRRIGAVKDKEEVIGNKVKVKIVKNKLAPPFKTVETELIFGHGFNKEGELLEMARDMDIIELSGSHYKYLGEEFANGKAKACEALRTDPKLFDSIAANVQMGAPEDEKKAKKVKKIKKEEVEEEYDDDEDEEDED